MEEGPRRGTRIVKPRFDKDFVYEERFDSLIGRENIDEANAITAASRHNSRKSAGKDNSIAGATNWSGLYDKLDNILDINLDDNLQLNPDNNFEI